jgi:hypothetical protein
VEWLKMNDILAKLLSNVIVVAMNYIFSKMFIFMDSSGDKDLPGNKAERKGTGL